MTEVYKPEKPLALLEPKAEVPLLPTFQDVKGWGRLAGMAVAAILLFIALTLISKTVYADGRLTYCYVEQARANSEVAPPFTLYGHREMRPDSRVGHFATLEDALKAASAMRCPLSGELK